MKTYLLFPPTEEDLRLPPRGMHWTVVQKYLTECSQRLIQTVDRSETDMELSLETWGVRLYCSSQKCLEAYRQLPLHSEEQLTLAYLVRNILNKRYSETGIEPERIPVRGEEGGKMGAEGIVFIEGGEYVRPERYYTSAGGLEEQRVDWYRVRVSSFYIDKFKVTNKAYCRFLNDGNPGYWNWTHKAIRREPDGRFVVDPDKANLPVSDVNWYQAVGYAEWVGKRLPTEAEWEYAAGGKEGRKYPWGNEEPDAARANAGFLGRQVQHAQVDKPKPIAIPKTFIKTRDRRQLQRLVRQDSASWISLLIRYTLTLTIRRFYLASNIRYYILRHIYISRIIHEICQLVFSFF